MNLLGGGEGTREGITVCCGRGVRSGSRPRVDNDLSGIGDFAIKEISEVIVDLFCDEAVRRLPDIERVVIKHGTCATAQSDRHRNSYRTSMQTRPPAVESKQNLHCDA